MFKFDFFSSEECSPEADHDKTSKSDSLSPSQSAVNSSYTARKIDPCSAIDARLESGVEGQVAWECGDTTLIRAIPNDGAFPTSEESDLVPGVYEGGMKLWEASIDLVEYLASIGIGVQKQPGGHHGSATSSEDGELGTSACGIGDGSGGRVLELGCGHGFPGIMALRQGMRVCFSDFNREVIEQVTIPNVRLNVPRELWGHAEFYCGDWCSLSPLLDKASKQSKAKHNGSEMGCVPCEEQGTDAASDAAGDAVAGDAVAGDAVAGAVAGGGRFNLILTAETLYTPTTSEKILELTARHLALGGKALVASKRFYFGTGGSTQYFRDLVDRDGRFLCRDVLVVNTGKGNIREVLEVRWKEGSGLADER